eukprot:6485008-Amphidinium_carterae.1
MADPKNESFRNQGRDIRVILKPSRERRKFLETAEKFEETRTASRCIAVLARGNRQPDVQRICSCFCIEKPSAVGMSFCVLVLETLRPCLEGVHVVPDWVESMFGMHRACGTDRGIKCFATFCAQGSDLSQRSGDSYI